MNEKFYDNMHKSYEIKNNRDKLKNTKLFVFDMDGTVYIDDNLLNGAKDFIDYLDKNKIPYLFFTNNSSKSVSLYIDKLKRLGININREKIMTSTDVMLSYLKFNHKNEQVYAIGTDSFLEELDKAGINRLKIKDAQIDNRPEVVLVGFDTQLDYDRLNKACHYIRKGAVFLATHPDMNCPCDYGYMVDCGAICAAISASTQKEVLYTGKPMVYVIDAIKDRYTSTDSKYKIFDCLGSDNICFVGDRLYTDIACAVDNKAIGCLVLSGETTKDMLDASDIAPDYVFRDLQEMFDTYLNG